MNIEMLRYFIALSEAGSFTKAAQQFYISQQGFNKSITTLEAEVGCKLVERSSKGIVLTKDGERFLSGAIQITKTYDKTLSELSLHRSDLDAVKSYTGRMIISPACQLSIMDSMEREGLIGDVSIQEMETISALELALNERWLFLLDIPWFAVDQSEFHELYTLIPIVETKIGIVGREDLVGLLPSSIAASDIANLTLGIYDNPTTRLMYEIIFEDAPLDDVIRSTTSFNSLVQNAERGKYSILLDSFQWKQYLERGGDADGNMSFHAFADDFTSTFGFVFKKNEPIDKKTLHYAESFTRVYRRLNALS